MAEQPDRYQRLDCIGRGSFGDVYRGCAVRLALMSPSADKQTLTGCSCLLRLDNETGREVAIKVIDLEDVYAPYSIWRAALHLFLGPAADRT